MCYVSVTVETTFVIDSGLSKLCLMHTKGYINTSILAMEFIKNICQVIVLAFIRIS